MILNGLLRCLGVNLFNLVQYRKSIAVTDASAESHEKGASMHWGEEADGTSETVCLASQPGSRTQSGAMHCRAEPTLINSERTLQMYIVGIHMKECTLCAKPICHPHIPAIVLQLSPDTLLNLPLLLLLPSRLHVLPFSSSFLPSVWVHSQQSHRTRSAIPPLAAQLHLSEQLGTDFSQSTQQHQQTRRKFLATTTKQNATQTTNACAPRIAQLTNVALMLLDGDSQIDRSRCESL